MSQSVIKLAERLKALEGEKLKEKQPVKEVKASSDKKLTKDKDDDLLDALKMIDD